MSMPFEMVPRASVVSFAMKLVDSSREKIELTMLAIEERGNPIPPEYFELLHKKLLEGITVTRIGFGSWNDFRPIADSVLLPEPNYVFMLTEDRDYRRMILVDNIKLLCALVIGGERMVVYSEERNMVGEYREYFRHMASRARHKTNSDPS